MGLILFARAEYFHRIPIFFSFSIAEKSDLIYNKIIAKLLGDANFTKQKADFAHLILK
jgi:hypothetical protein